MNAKVVLIVVLVSTAVLTGCSTAHISPEAKKIIKHSARYYQHLTSFEGTNTITDEGSFLRSSMVRAKHFAFVRPNTFSICSTNTPDNQLICDGRFVYLYKPYYWNSFTKTPAPKRFEHAVTNWVGGELVRLISSAKIYSEFKGGLRNGLKSLNYAGEDNIEGISCDHLVMELVESKTADVWIAKGDSPMILKYQLKFPTKKPNGGTGIHTETISGWLADKPIPEGRFQFKPSDGAIEQPPGANEVKLSFDPKTGKTTATFHSSPAK
jgi:hypothetical protein